MRVIFKIEVIGAQGIKVRARKNALLSLLLVPPSMEDNIKLIEGTEENLIFLTLGPLMQKIQRLGKM
jgi:hypothetical protein